MTEEPKPRIRKPTMSEERLGRIENKVDEVAKALVALVRVEERTTTLFKQNEQIRQDMEILKDKVSALERNEVGQGHFFRWVDRIGLAVATAVVIYFFSKAGLVK